MAFTKYTIDADGTESNLFPVSFAIPYYDKTNVQVRVNEEESGGSASYRELNWITNDTVEVLGASVIDGDVVAFTNTVDITEPVHDFQKRSIVTDASLDANQLQALTAVGMVFDGRFTGSFEDDIDLGGFRVINSGHPISGTDLVTKDYVDAIDPSASSALDAELAAQAAAASAAQSAASAVQSGNSATVAAANRDLTAADALSTAADRAAVAAMSVGSAWVNVVTITDDIILTEGDSRTYYLVDTSVNDVTVTMPAITVDGTLFGVQNLSSGTVTISAADTINGSVADHTLSSETESIQLLSDADTTNNWILLAVSQTYVGNGLVKDGNELSAKEHNLAWFDLSDNDYPTLVKNDLVKFSMGVDTTVTDVVFNLSEAQVSGDVVTFDVTVNGATMFSTPVTIDNTETSSSSASVPSVISLPVVMASDIIGVHCTQTGGYTAKGATVTIIGYPT